MGFFSDKDIDTETISSKLRRKYLAHGESLSSSRLIAEAGAIIAERTNSYNEIDIVLSGRFEFTLSGDTAMLSEGDSVYIPRDTPYSFVCLEKGEIITVRNEEDAE